jgi:hypothetical protein
MNGAAEGLRQFAAAMIPVIFTGASVLAGMIIIASSIRKMTRLGDQGGGADQPTWGGVGFGLLIGALLLQFSSTMNDVSDLLFGTKIQDVRGVLAYVDTAGGKIGPWKVVLEAVLMWVVFLGWISAFRGFLKWNQAANGQSQGSDPFWAGLWHIIGGAAAINLGGIVNSFFR